MWQWFLSLITQAIQFLHGIIGDWGLAIIALTLIFRVLLIPLNAKQIKSTQEMQRIQPLMKELQDKYKNDPEKLQAEMANFYKENKVNPLGGCLPSLVQMPIFIALFQVLRNTETFGGATSPSFLNIIPNLSVTPGTVWSEGGLVAVLPYAILVVLGAVATFIPQLLTAPDNKQSKTIGGYMSLMMLWFGWISPAGVVLYWVSSNLFGAFQQWVTMKIMKKDEGVPAVVVVEPIKEPKAPKQASTQSKAKRKKK